MPTRAELFEQICGLIGAASCKVISSDEGWPGIAAVSLPTGKSARVALHVSVVGSHARQEYEMRFQNPANRAPVANPDGSIPVLLGLAQVGLRPIAVAVDGRSRLGREARFSILFHKSLLDDAARDGWAEYVSTTDEHIFAFHPKLLGIFLEGVIAGVFPDAGEVANASAASGVVQDNSDASAERARTIASRLVRDAKFSKDVKSAYQERCAMCGLGLDLVVGAHIFPASAPASPDKVFNGMALCQNHHAAFDRHIIWIDPKSREIKMHPDILKISTSDAAAKTFASNTKTSISVPSKAEDHPSTKMFEQRYGYYEGRYNWV